MSWTPKGVQGHIVCSLGQPDLMCSNPAVVCRLTLDDR